MYPEPEYISLSPLMSPWSRAHPNQQPSSHLLPLLPLTVYCRQQTEEAFKLKTKLRLHHSLAPKTIHLLVSIKFRTESRIHICTPGPYSLTPGCLSEFLTHHFHTQRLRLFPGIIAVSHLGICPCCSTAWSTVPEYSQDLLPYSRSPLKMINNSHYLSAL